MIALAVVLQIFGKNEEHVRLIIEKHADRASILGLCEGSSVVGHTKHVIVIHIQDVGGGKVSGNALWIGKE